MNFKSTIITAFLVILFGAAFAQNGTIRGKISDGTTGEAMISATVRLFKDSTMVGGAYTDLDGNYTIANLAAGIYNLKVSYVSYKAIEITDVNVQAGNVTNLDMIMEVDLGDGDKNTVTIESKVLKNTENALLNIQRRSTNVVDGISSQQFKRTGDANAASAMGRITGLSVEGGKYIYVRGLGDRYSMATLNGAELPGLDPNRNSVQMDMFPTNLIDNIVVFKTFTPDLPGSFTGGLIRIATKDFPEKFTFNYNSSFSYNDQSSFRKDFLDTEHGKTDWLGMDDGTRAIPDVIGEELPGQSFSDPEEAAALDEASKAFKTSMVPQTGTSFMNHNHSVSIGNQMKIKDIPVGFVASLSYRSQDNFYGNGSSNRWKLTNQIDNAVGLDKLLGFNETQGSREVLWGGLVNFSIKPAPNHKLSANYLRNQSGSSTARYFEGELPDDDPNLIFETRTSGWVERSLNVIQVNGEHLFENSGNLKLDWIGSYALSSQNEPDIRFFSNDYTLTNGTPEYDIQRNLYNAPSRYFRDMKENNFDLRANLEVPFKQWNGWDAKIKTGGAFTNKNREFRERRFEYGTGSQVTAYEGDPDLFFSDENLGITQINYDAQGNPIQYEYGNFLTEATERRNNYDGAQSIYAGYGMVDLPLSEKLKFIGGARYEGTNLTVGTLDPGIPTGEVIKHDILPSANLIYSPSKKMNLRGSYSRTLARPTFRELAPYASFEFVRDFVLVGNENLDRTQIDNVDLRWEMYPTTGELLSVSGFYKHFTNPIERVINPTAGNTELNYRNVPEANLFGLEIELRKSLGFISPKLENFRVAANLSLIKSTLDINPDELSLIRALNPGASSTRPMFGQSPYTLNGEFAYANDTLGFQASLNFNVFGARISEVSVGGTPDVYEQPRPRLDFFTSKTIGKSFKLTFRARNLINPKFLKIHTFKEVDYVYQSYTTGRSFSLGFSYFIQ